MGQCVFLLVAVNYFTNWIEVEAMASITEKTKVHLEKYYYSLWGSKGNGL